MIYTDKTKLAMKIAYEAHKEQVGKDEMPYILHSILIADKMTTEDTTIIALLHDVIEDTELIFKDLESYGFNSSIIEALDCITRKSDEKYFDYINRVKSNKLATIVKIEDLKQNMDLSRLTNVSESDYKRRKKYKKAYKRLTEV